MGTKTISLSDEAYHRLKALKEEGESFSDVVLRLSGREDLMKYAGTISDAFAQELRGNIQGFRARFEQQWRDRVQGSSGPEQEDA